MSVTIEKTCKRSLRCWLVRRERVLDGGRVCCPERPAQWGRPNVSDFSCGSGRPDAGGGPGGQRSAGWCAPADSRDARGARAQDGSFPLECESLVARVFILWAEAQPFCSCLHSPFRWPTWALPQRGGRSLQSTCGRASGQGQRGRQCAGTAPTVTLAGPCSPSL